jgi:hypothetical protein
MSHDHWHGGLCTGTPAVAFPFRLGFPFGRGYSVAPAALAAPTGPLTGSERGAAAAQTERLQSVYL